MERSRESYQRMMEETRRRQERKKRQEQEKKALQALKRKEEYKLIRQREKEAQKAQELAEMKRRQLEEEERLREMRTLNIYHTKYQERFPDENELYTKDELMNPPEGETGRLSERYWELIEEVKKIFCHN